MAGCLKMTEDKQSCHECGAYVPPEFAQQQPDGKELCKPCARSYARDAMREKYERRMRK
jgi:formylmethanofuran dehydrogenase subunit E